MDFRSQSRRRPEASLDLTPLIDCVFLLLIFFLVTATFTRQPTEASAEQSDQSVVPVELPTGTSGESASADERATIFLESDGTYSLRARDRETIEGMSRGQLEEILRLIHQENPETALYLRGDREAQYGDVMRLLDIAREIGFSRVFNVIQNVDD